MLWRTGGAHGAGETHAGEIFFTQEGGQKVHLHPGVWRARGWRTWAVMATGELWRHSTHWAPSQHHHLASHLISCISISSSLKMELQLSGCCKVSEGRHVWKDPAPGKSHSVSFLRIALKAEMFYFIHGFLAVEKEWKQLWSLFIKKSKFMVFPRRCLAFLNHGTMFESLDFETPGTTLLHY